MNDLVAEIIRRAILDLLFEIGGEHNDDNLTLLLNQMGHRVARRDVRTQLEWLSTAQLVCVEALGPFLVARILPDGRDVAEGRLVLAGVGRFKTGE